MQRPLWLPDLSAFIAIMVVLLVGIIVLALLLLPIKPSEAAGTLLTAIVGMLVAKLGTIIDFFFGSSKASKEKDETIKSLANGHD